MSTNLQSMATRKNLHTQNYGKDLRVIKPFLSMKNAKH